MNDRIRDLVTAAITKTESGELKWTAFTSDSFRTKIGTGHLHIQRNYETREDDPNPATGTSQSYSVQTYSLQITDAQGRVVAEEEALGTKESFGWTTATPQHTKISDPSQPPILMTKYKLFEQLFLAVRNAVLKSDQVIESMLQELTG